jgi:phosphatidate phosphatase APP1
MKLWKRKLLNFFGNADAFIAKLNYKIRKRLHLYKDIFISTYNSYGTSTSIHVRGRVLENKNISPAEKEDSLYINVLNMYKRFYGEKVPGAIVELTFQQQSFKVVTDAEGYFEINIYPENPMSTELWQEVEVELVQCPVPFKGKVRAIARVMVPAPSSRFGVISDIDDTIIKSHATAKLKMFRTVTFKNAFTRHPFEGVSEFYSALKKGPGGQNENPFFYVSSSPWKLNDFLMDFLSINAIPEGAFLLKNLGPEKERKVARGHQLHKLSAITQIFRTYPKLNFILIGDSGQKDPLIYAEVLKRFPGRIEVIYIRDVRLTKKAASVLEIAAKNEKGQAQMLLIESMTQAMEHAVKLKLVQPSSTSH